MNKLSWALSLLVFILTAPYSFGKDVHTTVLTKDYLVSNEWGPEIGELGVFFKFTAANTYKTGTNFEGGEYYSGTYEIKNDTLILKVIQSTEWRNLIGKELKLRLTKDKNAIYFSENLALEQDDTTKDFYLKKIWNQSSIVKSGQKRVFQNVNAVTINDLAMIKESTTYYQFPNEDSKRFMFSIFDDQHDKSSDWLYSVPAEILRQPYLAGQIRLILKTAEKDNKNRYWYCIDLPIGNGGYDGLKLEGSGKEWNGRSIGWIKQTDVVKMKPRK